MEHNNSILVTGASSGLGKSLCDYFKGVSFSRDTSFADVMRQANQKPYQAIIHAAFNPRQDVSSADLQAYLDDTILLTKKIVQIPHQRFIFISSGDVYPKDNEIHQEDEEIKLKNVDSIYGIAKLMSESIVKNEAKKHLILRSTTLLGPHIRKNSFTKILAQDSNPLTLSDQSIFNYILHSDVSEFIKNALSLDLTGIYNMAASSNISLREVADFLKRNVVFGKYAYNVGNINNHKAASISSHFKKTSLDNIISYIKQHTIID